MQANPGMRPVKLGMHMQQAQQRQQQMQSQKNQAHHSSPQMMPQMTTKDRIAVTARDVQIARQKLGPQSQNFSDDQIYEILLNRKKQLLQRKQSRAMQ
jgi:Flp pilus assembly CpaF family ATPase